MNYKFYTRVIGFITSVPLDPKLFLFELKIFRLCHISRIYEGSNENCKEIGYEESAYNY